MISRITQSILARDLQTGIRRLQVRLYDAQEQVSTQRRLREPSDDPSGAAQAHRLHGEAADLAALREGVDYATSILGAEDSALDQAQAILARAREIAAQQATDLASPGDRQAAASEVAELERGLLTLGNTAVGGRHVFGGLATGAAPFAQLDDAGFDPSDPYSGPTDPFHVRSGSDQTTIRITTPGDQVFNPAIAALDELRTTLEAGDAPPASLDALDSAAEVLRAERSGVGGRARRLEERRAEIVSAQSATTERLGAVEGADLAASISELVQLQTALQATLQSAQALQASILDHLRL